MRKLYVVAIIILFFTIALFPIITCINLDIVYRPTPPLKIVISIEDGVNVGKIIYVDDDNTKGPWDGSNEYPYQFIQDAVNNATDGDTIIIRNGLYHGHVHIQCSVSIEGEDANQTIISYIDEGPASAIEIKCSGVSITKCHIIVSGRFNRCIHISRADNCQVYGNRLNHEDLNNNAPGILITGNGNIISRNEFSNFSIMIAIEDACKNKVISNNFYKSLLFLPISQSFYMNSISGIISLFIGNQFKNNYYNRPRYFPVPLLKWFVIREADPHYPNPLTLAIPLFDFDLNPAMEPYTITS